MDKEVIALEQWKDVFLLFVVPERLELSLDVASDLWEMCFICIVEQRHEIMRNNYSDSIG